MEIPFVWKWIKIIIWHVAINIGRVYHLQFWSFFTLLKCVLLVQSRSKILGQKFICNVFQDLFLDQILDPKVVCYSDFGPFQLFLELFFLETFKKSAEYNCEWATSTTVPLLDQLWIYSGILSRVPQLVEVSEQSQQKIKNNANKVSMDPRTAWSDPVRGFLNLLVLVRSSPQFSWSTNL